MLLMVSAGPLPWTLFATGLTGALNSLNNSAHLISKVYFSRLIIPIATVAVSIVGFLISFVILIFLLLWYWLCPNLRIVFVVFALLTGIGPSLWIAHLNVKYRDFRYIKPFVAQFGFYLSPVGFSSSFVPEQSRLLYAVNPMVGARWRTLGAQAPLYLPGLAVGFGSAFFIWLGVRQFRKFEKTFADLI
jgi:lipopolysaccharide transport system permease protein